jgi:hypothetical protein
MEYLKVQGEDGLVRDVSSQAILNTNNKEYDSYIARRDAVKAQKLELERQGRELTQVKSDLSEIKQMISILINKQ